VGYRIWKVRGESRLARFEQHLITVSHANGAGCAAVHQAEPDCHAATGRHHDIPAIVSVAVPLMNVSTPRCVDALHQPHLDHASIFNLKITGLTQKLGQL
jgi:hypothetical protein